MKKLVLALVLTSMPVYAEDAKIHATIRTVKSASVRTDTITSTRSFDTNVDIKVTNESVKVIYH